MSVSNVGQPSLHTDAPWHSPWPESELESVAACPACGSAERKVLHEGLIDNVFGVAPGKWALHRCTQCGSAYLDPRPNLASIGKAYGAYYTHLVRTHRVDTEKLGIFRRLRRMMANGYLNHRYGTKRHPASGLGTWVSKLLPKQRQDLDVELRYLPKPIPGQHLLDIGCGNGDFLLGARGAGWQVSGVEPDPIAADAALKRGVDVALGTVDLLAAESDCFDAITLSHVIEHVHEPKQLLKAVQRLLKPGGIVYIETPNIQSVGAKVFGKHWRGIETPRHLVLFNPASLTGLLSFTGFRDIKIKRHTGVLKNMHLISRRMAIGLPPYGSEPASLGWFETIRLYLSYTRTRHLEFITLTARKGGV